MERTLVKSLHGGDPDVIHTCGLAIAIWLKSGLKLITYYPTSALPLPVLIHV
jgi:hypothetical protein